MCLIVLAWNTVSGCRLALAANRDEYASRPTSRLDFHADAPHVLAGRDLEKGGTWLGVTRRGRFAAVTNFRGAAPVPPDARSRGLVVSEYLESRDPPQKFLDRLRLQRSHYRGFSLLAGDTRELWNYHSPKDQLHRLEAGIYGLSNQQLDSPWPKVLKAKAALSKLIDTNSISAETVFELLGDRSRPPDADLPDTGVGLQVERRLGSIFIDTAGYGTRSSTYLTLRDDGEVTMTERTHKPAARPDRHFVFRIDVGR